MTVTTDPIAQTYIQLALAIGQHISGYIWFTRLLTEPVTPSQIRAWTAGGS